MTLPFDFNIHISTLQYKALLAATAKTGKGLAKLLREYGCPAVLNAVFGTIDYHSQKDAENGIRKIYDIPEEKKELPSGFRIYQRRVINSELQAGLVQRLTSSDDAEAKKLARKVLALEEKTTYRIHFNFIPVDIPKNRLVKDEETPE
jgi:hypothetical protein